MDYVKLVRLSDNDYTPYESSNKNLWRLAAFLSFNVQITTDSNKSAYKKWLYLKGGDWIGGNTCYLQKSEEKENVIIIGDNIEPGIPDEIIFETTVEELADVLDQWAEVCKQEPEEIIIKRDGDKITLEGINRFHWFSIKTWFS
jgi:hypothetical protein